MAADPDILRILGRLEKAIDDSRKESDKQFDAVRQKQADQGKAIERLAESDDEIKSRLVRVEGTANAAMRTATESQHDIDSVNRSTVRHISNLETAIADGQVETGKRLDAQDKTLASQNFTLASIKGAIDTKTLVDEAAQKRFDKRLAVIAAMVVALVPVLSKLVDVIVGN